mgnify:CR=1 FL=1|jgi:hypothetical protein
MQEEVVVEEIQVEDVIVDNNDLNGEVVIQQEDQVEERDPVVEEAKIELPDAPLTINELKNVHLILGEPARGLSLD